MRLILLVSCIAIQAYFTYAGSKLETELALSILAAAFLPFRTCGFDAAVTVRTVAGSTLGDRYLTQQI